MNRKYRYETMQPEKLLYSVDPSDRNLIVHQQTVANLQGLERSQYVSTDTIELVIHKKIFSARVRYELIAAKNAMKSAYFSNDPESLNYLLKSFRLGKVCLK